MTPILDLQRRLREAGRIRIGQKVAMSNGKSRPAKLDTFRFTSADRRCIDAVAALYGGEVQPWADAPVGEQFEVVTDAKSIPVVLPPGPMALSQWYEIWSGGGCVRRCDGVNELIMDQSCVCDPAGRECKPHTRLSVILRDLEGIGTWRLDTSGWNATTELKGTMDIVESLQTDGRFVTGRLVLTQDQSKVDGKTLNYAVPGLDLDINVAAINAASDSPRPRLGEMVQEHDERVSSWPADVAPGPSTPALPPVLDDEPPAFEPSERIQRIKERRATDVIEVEVVDVEEVPDGPEMLTPPQGRNINRLLTKIGVHRSDREGRLQLCSEIIGRTIGSSLEITKAEAVPLIEALMERAGETPPTADERFAPHPGEEPFE